MDKNELNALADAAISLYNEAKRLHDPAASFFGAIRQTVGNDNETFQEVQQILSRRSAAKRHTRKIARRASPRQKTSS